MTAVACTCANNSVGIGHKPGVTPCQMTTKDRTARFWVIGIARAVRWASHEEMRYSRVQTVDTGKVYAYVWRSYNTLAGAQKWAHVNPEPIDWADIDWSVPSRGYQIVRNPNVS